MVGLIVLLVLVYLGCAAYYEINYPKFKDGDDIMQRFIMLRHKRKGYYP